MSLYSAVITLPYICIKVQMGKYLKVSYLTLTLNLIALQCVSIAWGPAPNYNLYHDLRGCNYYEVCLYVCQRSSQVTE